MLSIEDPPHPPCSSKISELTGDEGAAKKLALQEAADLGLVAVPGDEIKNQPPFSIRDFVSATRSKDVGVNWPFSPHLLQFCLKHGIKDPLPPFEHPHFVRAQRCREGLGPNQPIALVDSEKTSPGVDVVEEEDPGLSDLNPNGFKNISHQLFSESALESSDCAQCPLSEVDILPVEVGDEKLCRISKLVFSDEDCEETAPEASLGLENIESPQAARKTEALCEASGKKRRLIVKFGSQHNSVRAEENVLNPSTATESMTSKICPVCKTFTSTSNTTLNAHIDRCLAADSTSKWVVTKVTKKKVKPRKKKLMADIYLTAPSCTLEDLERRNCISWAVNSISPIQNDEVLAENKRQRMIQATYNDDGEECVLCDDSNSTKLRTSSKLNDTAVPTAVENCKHRENMKDSVDKCFLISKEKHLASTASKYMNVQPRSKKLCNIMHPNGEIHEAPDAKYHAQKNHEKEERLSQLLKAQDSFKGRRTGTLRQWVCSKRMRLLKKLNERSSHYGANEDQLLATQKPLMKKNQSALGNSSAQRRHIHKLSRFSVKADASPNIQSKTIMVTDDKMNSPQPPKNNSNRLIERYSFLGDGHNENFSRSLENNISTRSKRVKIDKSAAKESPKLSESFPISPKYKKSVSSENMLSGKSFSSVGINKCYENSKRPPRKKLRKLTFKPRERCMVEMRDQVVEFPFNEDKGIDRSLDNIMVSETEDFASKVLKSGHERQEAMIVSNIPESVTSKGFISSKPDRMNVDSEFGGCLHRHISSDVCAFNSSNQFFFAEGIRILNGQSGSSYSFGEEHVGSTFGSEAWAEPIRPRPCDSQDVSCTKDGELGGTSSRTIAEVNLLEGNFSDDEYMGCGTESIPIQESDGGLEALLEKLLVTSGGPGFIEYQQDLVNGNTSESPISVTSAISSPSMGLSSFKCPEMESSDNSTKSSLVDAIDSGPSAALPSVERTKSETGNTEFKISTGKECAKFSDYEPCCCLQKASVNWGPSPIYQESSKLMPMTSNQNISLESYNSFMTNQSLRTDAKVDTASRMMMGPICIKESFDDEVLSCTDLGFADPSSMTQLTSSPILRLMGQNLVVAKNEKEAVQRLGVSLGRAEINKTNERNVVCAGFCDGNISGQDTLSQNSNVDFSNNLRSCSNSKKPPTPPHLPCNHQDHLHMGGFMFSGFAAVKR
ncbi:hypothetical protein AAC387_Pa09g2075 [Persea americana]